MSVGIFTDRQNRPEEPDIRAALGIKSTLWDELIRFAGNDCGASGDLAFYGKNYGWALRFKRDSKALISLYPGKEGFTAQIIMITSQVDRASRESVSYKAKSAMAEANPYTEGRWLFLRVETAEDLKEVKHLLDVKLANGTL